MHTYMKFSATLNFSQLDAIRAVRFRANSSSYAAIRTPQPHTPHKNKQTHIVSHVLFCFTCITSDHTTA
jgi:hypothetical protein